MKNNYDLIKLTQEDIPNYINFGIYNAPCVLYGIHDKNFAWICEEEMCDFDYILQNGIPYKKINGAGSTIVCSEGDLDLGFFGEKDFCEKMFEKISEFVSGKLTNGKFLNNDFMYNGNKYGSITRINLNSLYYIGVHLSNNINKELIEKICKKRCYKQPEKLPYTITEEDILNLYEE